jgi:hypothetical protein
MSLADKAHGKGNLFDNLNAVTVSCLMFDQDALMIGLVVGMYHTAGICMR